MLLLPGSLNSSMVLAGLMPLALWELSIVSRGPAESRPWLGMT